MAVQRTTYLVLVSFGLALAGGCAQIVGADFDRPLEGAGGGGGTATSSSRGSTTGTKSSTNTGTATAAGGGGASAGGGGSGGCNAASDCPAPMNDCKVATCDARVCGEKDAMTDKPCASGGGAVCDGNGACVQCNDAAACPASTNPCTDAACGASHTCGTKNKPDTTACGTGLMCLGGSCACMQDAECQDPTNECQAKKCQASACTFVNQPKGTACTDGGSVCDATGDCVGCNVDMDCTPTGNPCTTVGCTSGACVPQDVASETDCGGGKVCDGNGACVECVAASDCQPNQCQTATCVGNMCILASKTNGTTCSASGGNACEGGVCVDHCADGVQNVDETGQDCGGSTCPGCANGTACAAGSDCASGFCSANVCAVWARTISSGGNHVCAALKTTLNDVDCWGANNHAQLGDGTTVDRTTPVKVMGLGAVGAQEVAAGWTHSCAPSGNNVYCWGDDTTGQLGNGATGDQVAPVSVSGLTAGHLAAGFGATCYVRTTTSAAECWGGNGDGQLGDGTETKRLTPVAVQSSSNVAQVSTGDDFACERLSTGAVWCWGSNVFGTLGDGTLSGHNGSCFGDDCSNVPITVLGFSTGGATGLSARPGGSEGLACAVTTAGAVQCWGSNKSGQLGDGVATHVSCGGSDCSPTPVTVSGLSSGASTVSASGTFACAVISGGVKCWGNNASGQLGDGTTTNSNKPIQVTGLTSGVATVSVGGAFACALTTAGGVKCWGANANGQLGNGTMTNSKTPVFVKEL